MKYFSNFELSAEQIYACIFVGLFITFHWISCVFYTIGVLQVEGNSVTRKFPWIIEHDMCPTQIGTNDATLSPFTSSSAALYATRKLPYVPNTDWFSGARGVNSSNTCIGVPKTTWERYLTSLYWSVVTMATVGYGDFTASTNMEYAFIIFIAVAGTLLSAGIMGFISSQIAFDSANGKNSNSGLKAIRKKIFVSPLDSGNKIKFLKNIDSMMEFAFSDHLQVLKAFPQFYHENLLQSLFQPHMDCRAIFSQVHPLAKEALCLMCKTYLCTDGEILLSQGSTDRSLYLLTHGEAQIIGNFQDGHLLYETLRTDGDYLSFAYFGEQVISRSLRTTVSTATLLTQCTLGRIHGNSKPV